MDKVRFLLRVAIFSAVIFSATALAADVRGTYSSMKVHSVSGDLIGIELTIIPSRLGSFVLFQSSEGEPDVPVLVPSKISGKTVTFILPEGGSYSGKVVGTVSGKGLRLKFHSGAIAPDGASYFVLRSVDRPWYVSRPLPGNK